MVSIEETLNAKRARVKLLEYDVAAKAKKRQLLLAKRPEMSEEEICQLVDDGESPQ